MKEQTVRRPAARRLAVVLAVIVVGAVVSTLTGSFGAGQLVVPPPTPVAKCGPGSLPETGTQGRVPTADYTSGRAAKGYRCNTRQVSHQGSTGGFKVQRYRDAQGNVCAFYDSTLVFPKDVLFQGAKGQGVIVLDMNDPARPRQTANLTTPGMLSPHESLLVNQRRGILGAVLGSALTNAGILDLYDVRTDCRHPRLLSSTPTGIFGHESGWAPDGKTFWSVGAAGMTLTAVDVTDPRKPRTILTKGFDVLHGVRLSGDGKTMYVARIGVPDGAGFSTGGLRILDVSEVQERRPNPRIRVLSDLTWPEHSIPQVAEPFTKNGHRYLLEVDEFSNFGLGTLLDEASVPVGAARIINVDDPRKPRIVSNLRLKVHQPAARAGAQRQDPGAALPIQGYAAHYCSVPTRTNPTLAGCSMILSGLRIFDISDVTKPREVGYFNKPTAPLTKPNAPQGGAYAMSQPAWDLANKSIWYTDVNAGFFAVRMTNGIAD
jgi:hypothetical protein